MELIDLARKGYEGYASFTGNKTFDGRDMPSWEALPERIQQAWRAATTAILLNDVGDDE